MGLLDISIFALKKWNLDAFSVKIVIDSPAGLSVAGDE